MTWLRRHGPMVGLVFLLLFVTLVRWRTRDVPLEDALEQVVQNRVEPLPRKDRGQIALWLTEAGISQRQVHELTGVSRDTIRKKTKPGSAPEQDEE